MAVQVILTCADRNGRVLARTSVVAPTFEGSRKERTELYERWKHQYADHNDIEPYIFTETRSTQ